VVRKDHHSNFKFCAGSSCELLSLAVSVSQIVKEAGAGVFAARPAKVTSENESTNEIPIRPGD